MKTSFSIFGSIVLVALVAAGSFWAGVTYQSSRVDRTRANFEAARGQINPGQSPGGAPGFPQDGMPGIPQGDFTARGGTIGQVKEINDDVLTLSTAQDVITVTLSDTTQIEKSVEAGLADLQPGTRVLATGERDSDGDINASQITILNGDLPGPGGQAAAGMAP